MSCNEVRQDIGALGCPSDDIYMLEAYVWVGDIGLACAGFSLLPRFAVCEAHLPEALIADSRSNSLLHF